MTRKMGSFETKFVYRQTWYVKTGKMEEFIRLLTAGTGSSFWNGKNVTNRAYLSELGISNVVAWEAEFDSFEEFERLFDEWVSSPGFAAQWTGELNDLIAHGGTREGWLVAKTKNSEGSYVS